MAIRDTQDVLIVEQPFTSGAIRDTQDVLILEVPTTAFGSPGHLRVTQDAMLFEYPSVTAMFVYQAAGASVTTKFTPQFPPVKKQPFTLWGLEATRHDSLTSAGAKRSALERLDNVTTLTFPFVTLADMASWKALETYALTGAIFAYCPSFDPWMQLDETAFSAVQLLSMDWKPKFESFGIFSLEMKIKIFRDM